MEQQFSSISDHIVILGWSERVKRIIGELRNDNLKRSNSLKPILIIAGEDQQVCELPYDRIYVIRGSSTDAAVLRRANVQQAAAVLIPTRLTDTTAADGEGLFALLNVISVNPDIHASVELAEVCHSQTIEHVRHKELGAGKIEVVSLESVSERLLAQSVINPGVTDVYNHLLSFDVNSNEIYVSPVGDKWVGCTFRELAEDCFNNSVILIGYESSGRQVLNPRERQYLFEPGDKAWFIAYDKADGMRIISPGGVDE